MLQCIAVGHLSAIIFECPYSQVPPLQRAAPQARSNPRCKTQLERSGSGPRPARWKQCFLPKRLELRNSIPFCCGTASPPTRQASNAGLSFRASHGQT